MDFFLKSESLLYTYFAEKLGINLVLISRLVSDILGKQECMRRGGTLVGMRSTYQIQRMRSWES